MLERERFLAIKTLANKIYEDNKDLFKKLNKGSINEAIIEKEEFIENVIDSMNIRFDNGEQGREERQIFRANILLPNDKEFFKAYSKDKNLRNLMNKFSVGIEDIMSKITELNVYGKYLDDASNNKKNDKNDDFVDEMINLSSNEAQNLLDEIEDLSNVMENLGVTDEMDYSEPETHQEKEFDLEPEKVKESVRERDNNDMPDFDNLGDIFSGFVEDYDDLQRALASCKQDLDEATEHLNTLYHENEELKKNNLEAVNTLNQEKDARTRLEAENVKLHDRLEEIEEKYQALEEKYRKSSALLRKIYNSIPKNR